MKKTEPVPYEALERIFHELNRFSILSALCASDEPLSFTQIKQGCNLTDGNLNRHLKALQEEGVIRMDKAFVHLQPRTTNRLTAKGLDRFRDYLVALGDVLKSARKAVPARHKAGWAVSGRRAEA